MLLGLEGGLLSPGGPGWLFCPPKSGLPPGGLTPGGMFPGGLIPGQIEFMYPETNLAL